MFIMQSTRAISTTSLATPILIGGMVLSSKWRTKVVFFTRESFVSRRTTKRMFESRNTRANLYAGEAYAGDRMSCSSRTGHRVLNRPVINGLESFDMA